jgi:glycosyltransferase involved in cell wall biosynthesis
MLTVGNWVARKGILDLLVAFGHLPGDAATLHLVGRTDQDPAYTDRVQTRLAAPELRGRVVVHGPLPPHEVSPLYAGSDVFVLPSYEEAYGTVYGEALERVASDDEYRGRLSAAARVRGRQLPTWRESASLFFDTLKGVVERARR